MIAVLEWVAGFAGLVLVLGTGLSLFRTLVVPRQVNSRLGRAVGLTTRAVLKFVARHVAHRLADGDLRRAFEIKDRFLAYIGPVALLGMLVAWQLLLLLGFTLMLLPVFDGGIDLALRQAGSSFFTLGYASDAGADATTIDFLAAFAGLVSVALLIGYLPALYGAFNRRELLVTQLESRAGAPPWGPEILARHHLVRLDDALREFYDDWETWAADVAESHSSYPVLLRFRSPNPYRSWIIGLLAVMDSAALYLAFCPDEAPSQARLCLRQGFNALRDIAIALQLPVNADPYPDDPIALSYEEFLHGVERLRTADFPMERSPEEAWPHFAGWRVNYEELAYRIADLVDATPAPWSGIRPWFPFAVEPKRPRDRKPGDREAETDIAGRTQDSAFGATQGPVTETIQDADHDQVAIGHHVEPVGDPWERTQEPTGS